MEVLLALQLHPSLVLVLRWRVRQIVERARSRHRRRLPLALVRGNRPLGQTDQILRLAPLEACLGMGAVLALVARQPRARPALQVRQALQIRLKR